jgi:branched-chain amino acid transport system ATP-binding protein
MPKGSTRARKLLPELRAGGARLAPILSLGALTISSQLHAAALSILAPEISESLDIERETLAGFLAIETLVLSLGMLPVASLARRRVRGLLCAMAGMAWSVAGGLTGLATRGWHLLAGQVARGAVISTVPVVHSPLLLDLAPPGTRARVLSLYQGVGASGGILAPLLVGGLSAAGLGWQGIVAVAGVIAVVVAVPSFWIRDPGVGRYESAPDAPEGEEASLGVFESFHRLLLIPTVQRMLWANAVLGVALVPLATFLLFFLRERWGLSPGARGVFIATMPLFVLPALAVFARPAERRFATDPPRLVRDAALLMGIGALCLVPMVAAPVFPLMVLASGAATAAFAVLTPILNLIFLSVVPPVLRGHASALAGLYLAGVGGLGGLLVLSGIERRFGPTGAIGVLVVPFLLAALVLRTAARTVNADLAAREDERKEREAMAAAGDRGERFPLLSCRGVRVSYAGVEILHGIDLDIEEGEIVAILGTNGAGKTTLLRAISGLAPATGGVIRVDGEDVTHIDTERRVRRGGLVCVPAAEACFLDLSVEENLALFGFREKGTALPSEVFEAFPVLERRMSVPAGRLSGGERRMLALAQALVVRPRLLLIDELSFGVAPAALPGLLERVRSLHRAGVTIVLVEQSPAVASEVAPRAVFLHEGKVRFDGPTDQLLKRSDLLQPVFLGLPSA